MVSPVARVVMRLAIVGLLVGGAVTTSTCGGADSMTNGPRAMAGATPTQVQFEYAARRVEQTGLSREVEMRPLAGARYAQVRGPELSVIASGVTDALGRAQFSSVRSGDRVRVDAVDSSGANAIASAWNSAALSFVAPLSERVTFDGDRDSGALRVFSTVSRGVEVAERWIERPLPSVIVQWDRGVTTSWSRYHGCTTASGPCRIELLAGRNPEVDDTDEHDDDIVLHELGHMVMDVLGTHSSLGGDHPPGVLVDPGLAWEEGRAIWFASAVQAKATYQDAIGLSPRGRLRVNYDLEVGDERFTTPSSELTVAEVLWDLVDGSPEVPNDLDNDGVAISPRDLLRAMAELGASVTSYPYLGSYLRHLVRTRRISAEAARALVARCGEATEPLLPDDENEWPPHLVAGEDATGTIDSLDSPAPSGGPRHPFVGRDATHTFRLWVVRGGEVVLRLDTRAGDQGRLAVDLRDTHAHVIATSEKGGVRAVVSPGLYIAVVRDVAGATQAQYRLAFESPRASAASARRSALVRP